MKTSTLHSVTNKTHLQLERLWLIIVLMSHKLQCHNVTMLWPKCGGVVVYMSLTWSKERKTGQLPIGPQYSFQIKVKLAFIWKSSAVKRKMRNTRPNNPDCLKATIKATWASITSANPQTDCLHVTPHWYSNSSIYWSYVILKISETYNQGFLLCIKTLVMIIKK